VLPVQLLALRLQSIASLAITAEDANTSGEALATARFSSMLCRTRELKSNGGSLAVPTTVREVLSALAVVAIYAVAFWRIVKRNARNRVIECGGIALVVFVLLAKLINIKGLPSWLVPSLGLLLFILCLLTMVFLFLQAGDAVRSRKAKVASSAQNSSDQRT
jgi:hypothetical protein